MYVCVHMCICEYARVLFIIHVFDFMGEVEIIKIYVLLSTTLETTSCYSDTSLGTQTTAASCSALELGNAIPSSPSPVHLLFMNTHICEIYSNPVGPVPFVFQNRSGVKEFLMPEEWGVYDERDGIETQP